MSYLTGGQPPRFTEHLGQEGRVEVEVLLDDVQTEEVAVDAESRHRLPVRPLVFVCCDAHQLDTLVLLHDKQDTRNITVKHKQALSTLVLLHNKQHTRNITVNTNKPCLLSSFYTTNNTHGILLQNTNKPCLL